jgi:rRNA maturation protein Nop10
MRERCDGEGKYTLREKKNSRMTCPDCGKRFSATHSPVVRGRRRYNRIPQHYRADRDASTGRGPKTVKTKAEQYREGLEQMLSTMFPDGIPAPGEPAPFFYMISGEAAYYRLKVGQVMRTMIDAIEDGTWNPETFSVDGADDHNQQPEGG